MAALAHTPISDCAKELVRLCRAGRLYEIDQWLAAGKPLDVFVAKNRRSKTLLQIAVETGFHSLVELIARHETNLASKNAALVDSVSLRRLDFVELLVENGADITSVPLADVLLTWEPRLMRFFLSRGTDPIKGFPFATAFGAKIRTAIRAFVEYKQAHSELAAALQEQSNVALRYFCSKGDMKWISLMLWAGADARAMGPSLDETDPTDPDCYVSAMQEACYAGNVEVLKKLKPEGGRDDLENLLHCAAVSGRRDAIRYLLELGAKPNDKEDGGSSALDTCIWHLGFPSFSPYGFKRPKATYQVSNDIDNIHELAGHGAIWKPDRSSVNSLRRNLYQCEPRVTIDLLRVLMKHNACSTDQARELLKHPRMREHLASESWHLTRLKLDLEDNQPKGPQPPPAHLLAQYNREELYEKVWALPTREVAKHYGFSDVRLGKLCKILRVPKPGRGYWAKKEAGKPTPKRLALPSLETLKAGW
jgi:Ankyrin repeats (3 copies)